MARRAAANRTQSLARCPTQASALEWRRSCSASLMPSGPLAGALRWPSHALKFTMSASLICSQRRRWPTAASHRQSSWVVALTGAARPLLRGGCCRASALLAPSARRRWSSTTCTMARPASNLTALGRTRGPPPAPGTAAARRALPAPTASSLQARAMTKGARIMPLLSTTVRLASVTCRAAEGTRAPTHRRPAPGSMTAVRRGSCACGNTQTLAYSSKGCGRSKSPTHSSSPAPSTLRCTTASRQRRR